MRALRYPLAALAAATLALSSIPAYAAPANLVPASIDEAVHPLTYRSIFNALDRQDWALARSAILALPASEPLRDWFLAELLIARNSPRAELFELVDLIARAPDLPQTAQLVRLAETRGATNLPRTVTARSLVWSAASSQRGIMRGIRGEAVADDLRSRIGERVKADDPAGAEALVNDSQALLSADTLTEMRQRVAWSWFIEGESGEARRVAAMIGPDGSGPFLAPARWVEGLAAWRERDWSAANAAFAFVATRAEDPELRSAGAYWASRAARADGRSRDADLHLRDAARAGDSLYALLAREALGLGAPADLKPRLPMRGEWSGIAYRRNVKIATMLAGLGRSADADEVLRHEASLADGASHQALLDLASELSLPSTQLWLAQRSPDGRPQPAYLRFPKPSWMPEGGWKVDRALVLAHTLQESRFRAKVVSSAGAVGLMQVRPGAAMDVSGISMSIEQLKDPAKNLQLGQGYLQKLAAMSATGGLLPKVIAAYNAGPAPVETWNQTVRDDGDPLLFLESVPYYETRAYLNAVLRNYGAYQMLETGQSPVISALARGLWPRFPVRGQVTAVRIAAAGSAGNSANGAAGSGLSAGAR
jgi:soluble lytic murein transglycosylase